MFGTHVLTRADGAYRCDACGRSIPVGVRPRDRCIEPVALGYKCLAVQLPAAPDEKAEAEARSQGYADWDSYVRAVHETLLARNLELAAMR